MNLLETIGAFIGIPLGLLGVAGGLFSLRESFNKWRNENRDHGSKGASFFVLGKIESDDYTDFHLLIAGDLWQLLYPLVRDTHGKVESLTTIGNYYELKFRCDPGTDLTMRIKKSK